MHNAIHPGRLAVKLPRRTGVAPQTSMYLMALIMGAVLLAACSGNGPDEAQKPDESDISPSSFERTSHSLPEFFPDQIPLADEHVIVRNESRISERHGRDIAMNIALPGTIEEWRARYEEVLERDFEGIEFIEDHASLQWRFHGQGFDYAVLYLNPNRGYLDRGEIDSTHLPVMLTLTMTEHRE